MPQGSWGPVVEGCIWFKLVQSSSHGIAFGGGSLVQLSLACTSFTLSTPLGQVRLAHSNAPCCSSCSMHTPTCS